jgi:IKI3 family
MKSLVAQWCLRCSRSSLPSETINRLCDGIRIELEQRDIHKFVNAVLTAYVVKTPPDYEAGLSLLLRLRGTSITHVECLFLTVWAIRTGENPALVEDAVKYIIFLVDVDRLFDTALGMYDFSLVLLVSQYSQKASSSHPRQACCVVWLMDHLGPSRVSSLFTISTHTLGTVSVL